MRLVLACVLLAGCASVHADRSVLWITGLGGMSPGFVAAAHARGDMPTWHGAAIDGDPAALIGHSLGADLAARQAGKACPRLTVLIDPTRPADLRACANVHLIRSGWGRYPVIAGAVVHDFPASSHIGAARDALPLIRKLLKETGL